MCKLCENKPKTNQIIDDGADIALNAGIDENSRLYLEAVAESYTGRYYPKYCPECGRKLQVIS